MTPGTHGSTFGGNPLAMSVGNAVLDIIFSENFLENVKKKGEYLNKGLINLKDKHPKIINEIRGIGLFKGIKISVDTEKFIKKLLENKMLTVKASENTIRLLPSLIVTNEEIDEAMNKIHEVCKNIS